jgi:hypothetical protein
MAGHGGSMTETPKDTLKHALQHQNSLLGGIIKKLQEIKNLQNILDAVLEPKLAAACQVATLENDCLTLITHSALWATRFRFQIPQLLEKLKNTETLQSLKTIHCKIMPRQQSAAESGIYEVAPMQSLSPATAKLIIEAAQTIKDEKLKAVMEKISRQSKIGD